MNARTVLLAGLILTAPLVAGCGKLGDLERPAPRTPEEAQRDAARRAESEKANKPANPGSDEEVADPARSGATISQKPIKGSNPDPFGGPSEPGMPGSGPQR